MAKQRKLVSRRKRDSMSPNRRVPVGLTKEVVDLLMSLPTNNLRFQYLQECLLDKFVSDQTDAPSWRKQRAINKWLAAEVNNEATEVRLQITPEEYNILPRVTYGRFIQSVRYFVSLVLPEVPPVDALIGVFSGGASTSRKRYSSYPAAKYTGKAHITESARRWLFQDEFPGWPSEAIDIVTVPGNVMFTVLKSTDIDRVACKEPDLNMWLQRGVGNFIRQRLRKIGINLNDQSVNRGLARIGSIDGSLSTLDLSSASDSITCSLCELCLPFLWYGLLMDLRSPTTLMPDGSHHENVMISSMGNGFTFELESLLFWAITRAACHYASADSHRVSVYGDDIICPSGTPTSYAITALEYLGFNVNLKKSFTEGNFRESCGGHYYCGRDFTPFYLRGPLRTVSDVIHLANSIRRWSDIDLNVLDPLLEDIWRALALHVPKRFWGGDDTASIGQLVSCDLPKDRLMSVSLKKETGDGGYYHWLNTAWDRESSPYEAVVTSETSLPPRSPIWVIRRSKHRGIPSVPSWLHEVCQ